MQTVAAARAWAIEEFKRMRVGNPVLTADLLLGSVLGWERVHVLSRTEQKVPEEAWIRYQQLVARRARGEPLQYLTGEKDFYGLSFHVAPGVLIPRPETEILVEKAIDLIKSCSHSEIRFADIGAGSGCIGISILHEIPSSAGWAIDLSAAALAIARGNAIRHKVNERILLVQADLLECFPIRECFDMVLCNPPYVALREYASLPSEVRDYEPHEALFGGESGFEIYHRLVPEVASRIFMGGHLLLEVGAGQAHWVGQLIEAEGLSLEMILKDLRGIERCIVAQKIRRRNNG
jgi:release factor glutamine methyltransferase